MKELFYTDNMEVVDEVYYCNVIVMDNTVQLYNLAWKEKEINYEVSEAKEDYRIRKEYEELPSKVLVGGDSETVLAAREKSCGALGEYFGNRIGECWDLQGKISELVG